MWCYYIDSPLYEPTQYETSKCNYKRNKVKYSKIKQSKFKLSQENWSNINPSGTLKENKVEYSNFGNFSYFCKMFWNSIWSLNP